MKKVILLSMIIFIFCLKSVYAEECFGFDKKNPFTTETGELSISSEVSAYSELDIKLGMANPAAVYCVGLGYSYKIINGANGQYGICTFTDGSQCEEWQFLEGLCGQKYSYCALNGYDIETNYDGNNSLSPVYSVCVNKTDGNKVDSVTTIFNLAEKATYAQAPLEVSNVSQEKISTQSVPSLPALFDWRDATYNGISGNWLSDVKDQGVCGSCGIQSTLGSVEAAYKIYKNDPALNPDFSEEYLLSDCLPYDNCAGSFIEDAQTFIRDQGIPDDACMPYASFNCHFDPTRADRNACGADCRFFQNQTIVKTIPYACANTQCQDRCANWQSRTKRTDSIGFIKGKSRDEIKEDLIKIGPLSAGMMFGPDFGMWEFPFSVYRCSVNEGVNHAVVIVGYDDDKQAWIVKNSYGTGFPANYPGYEGEDMQGYFYVHYGSCAIENLLWYASGFNGLTTWHVMEVRDDTTHDGSNADVETFSSPQAPANIFAVSCVSKSATDERQDWYGDDDIVGIFMNNNQCTVTVDDVETGKIGGGSGFEQKRETGVVALPQSYTSQPNITWANWDMRNNNNHDGSNAKTETFTNNNSCPSNYFPVSCSSNSANNEREDWYGEDDIVGINITAGSSPKCQITAYDNLGDGEQKRMVATVCLPQQPTIVWGNWETRDDTTHDGADSRVETFYGPFCPSNYFPVSCLSESANKEREDWYGEDAIQNIVISGNRCIVSARDEEGNGDHKRRVATVCLPRCPKGDVDNNGIVNLRDTAAIIGNFSKPLSSCPRCDVNGDGTINMRDIALTIANFNKKCMA